MENPAVKKVMDDTGYADIDFRGIVPQPQQPQQTNSSEMLRQAIQPV